MAASSERSENPDAITDPWLDPGYPESPMPVDNSPYAKTAEPVIAVCRRCCTDLKANKVPPLSTVNKNYFGPVPPELKDLTIVEEAMISLCSYEATTLIPASQQLNAASITLPPPISDIITPICVIFVGSKPPTAEWSVFDSQEISLVNFLVVDHGRKPTKETAKGGDDDRDVHGPMLGARIGDLMCCVVVMQVEDRSHSELKGNDVYDRIYRLKANVTERIYNKSDLLCIDCNGIADPSPTWDASSAKEESAYVWKRVREVQKHESREEKVSERRFERAKGRARTDPYTGARECASAPKAIVRSRLCMRDPPRKASAQWARFRTTAPPASRPTPTSRTFAYCSNSKPPSVALDQGACCGRGRRGRWEGECKGGGDKDEFTNRRVPVHCSKPKPPFLRMAESAPEEGDGEASGGRGGGRGGYGAGFGVGLRYVENGPMPDPGVIHTRALPPSKQVSADNNFVPPLWTQATSVCPAAGQESAETCGDDGAMKERESLRRGHMYVLAGRREAGAGRSGRGRRGGLG
ncbi:hypothetical protein B0H13DRAFT_1908680 [Mycena leptocephala]|nr:hypothetical protein B0H13DRAFT_1908680 [Mycena leptocephala]